MAKEVKWGRESHYEMKEGSSFFCSDAIIAKRIISNSQQDRGKIRGNQIYQNKQVELDLLEASIVITFKYSCTGNDIVDSKRILFANERAQMSE